jgi:hypothetical protein
VKVHSDELFRTQSIGALGCGKKKAVASYTV